MKSVILPGHIASVISPFGADATLTPDDTPTYTLLLDHTRRLRLYMGGSDKRKQSLYFPEEMLKEIQDLRARVATLEGGIKQ